MKQNYAHPKEKSWQIMTVFFFSGFQGGGGKGQFSPDS
jgi:hypothetical protein